MNYTKNRNILTPTQTRPEVEPTETVSPYREKESGPRALVAILITAIVIACASGLVVYWSITDQPSAVAAVEISTKTPPVPTEIGEIAESETQRAPSPFPTLTPTEIETARPTETPGESEPEVVYIERPVIEYVTVEISQTPPETTSTPYPTMTSTVSEFILNSRHATDMQIRNDRVVMRLKEFFLSPAFIVTLFSAVALVGAYLSLSRADRPTIESTTEYYDRTKLKNPEETAAEYAARLDNISRIENIPVNSSRSRSLPTFEELAKVKEIVENNPDVTKSEIEESVFGGVGGPYWRKATKALKLLGYETSPPPSATSS